MENKGQTLTALIKSGVEHEPNQTIWHKAGYLLFFLMLFSPTLYQPAKAALLLLVVTAIVVCWGRTGSGFVIRPALALPVGGAVLVGLLFTARGVANGFTDGALSMAPVFVIWPLVYLLLTAGISTESHLRSLFRTIIFATLAAGIYGVLFVASQMIGSPLTKILELVNQRQIYYSDAAGSYSASFAFLSTLVHTVPFLTALLISWPRDERPPASRILIGFALALGGTVAVLSGRRALILVILSSLLIAVVFYMFMHVRRLPTKIIGRVLALGVGTVITAAVVITATDLNVAALVSSFSQGFSPAESADASIRYAQSVALWDAWSKNPLLGSGLGGTTPGLVRDEASPWAYELSYNAYLYHFGIVGVTLYAIGFAAIFVQSVRIARAFPEWRRYILPALVGLTCFLIANATNPYLAKFDSLWVVFLPLMILSVIARRIRSESSW
ncbi:hypothetical protein SAMN04489806_2170 [Paramicrobacterium humi]|uniref:O-antigen ligase n=1 Tax=Paramicrobacterium humi TaxID=640635 RepID=A0A1H4NE73_9MICO|nr:hypothetical protein [Microbacterium humi]SEB93610.1 hypothetical protein SAMN04489806_2170 [Microbacterium humi]